MLRTLITAAFVYAYGHPAFDGYRPAVLDKPMHGFYTEINGATQDGQRALQVLDEARTMQYLNRLMNRLGNELRANA